MKKLIEYGRDDHPEDDAERSAVAWSVAVLDDCDGCDDLRVEMVLEEIGRAYALLADRDSRRAFIHTLRSVVDYEGQRVSALGRLRTAQRIPALIVWGENDRVVPARQGKNVLELVPHIQLKVFKHAGHFPHRDDPTRFVRVVHEFLARGAVERRGRAALGA